MPRTPSIFLSSLLLSSLLGVAAYAGSSRQAISWQPATLKPGSPALFEIAAPAAHAVSAQWLGHKIEFFRSGPNSLWYGLGGVSLETKPGVYDLLLQESVAGGKTLEIRRQIKILRATYPQITVNVAKQYTEPNPAQLAQINLDREFKQKLFAQRSETKEWSGDFQPPVSLPISDIFGTARVFNGEVQSRHQGLDFAAPAGTPVAAVNSGTVILARALYFEGNCVVIDHGQGLMSLYLHLSEFKAKEGEKVDKGQEIALSGGSGRATGPHLHLAIRWEGIYLDPAILLKLNIP